MFHGRPPAALNRPPGRPETSFDFNPRRLSRPEPQGAASLPLASFHFVNSSQR